MKVKTQSNALVYKIFGHYEKIKFSGIVIRIKIRLTSLID